MLEDVRKNSMMARLLDALERGEDVGHYGRLVFLMVARHFASADELADLLSRDQSCGAGDARRLIAQVEEAGYSPPKREKILDFQGRQTYPILENPTTRTPATSTKICSFPTTCTNTSANIAKPRRAPKPS
jgi:hypothetical protein